MEESGSYCTHCGAKIEPSSSFCSSCGRATTQLAAPAQNDNKVEKEKKFTQNTTTSNRKQKKEYISAKEEVKVWLALIGIGLLVVGTILSAISVVISFTADRRIDIESSNMYFLYGITMIIVGIILSKVGLGSIGNKKRKQQQGQEHSPQRDQQQHKITTWFGRTQKEGESKKKEKAEQQQRPQTQTPLTAEEIRSRLDKDKRIMRGGGIMVIIGLVLFGLVIIFAFVLGFRNLYFTLSAIVLIIAGAIIYRNRLGQHQIQEKEGTEDTKR